MNYRISAKSLIGKRDEQQDAYSFFKVGNLICAVVCDGMGGMECGKTASNSTIDLITQIIQKTNGEISDIPDFLLHCIDTLDENVCKIKKSDNEKANAGTTIVVCIINGDKLFWLSIGDSRLYISRGNEIEQATRDHNLGFTLEQMKNENKISLDLYNEQVTKSEMLTSYIGMGGIDFYDICQSPFIIKPGDILLITTDGLYRTLSENELVDSLLHDDEAANAFETRIKDIDKPNQDNATFIIIKAMEE